MLDGELGTTGTELKRIGDTCTQEAGTVLHEFWFYSEQTSLQS